MHSPSGNSQPLFTKYGYHMTPMFLTLDRPPSVGMEGPPFGLRLLHHTRSLVDIAFTICPQIQDHTACQDRRYKLLKSTQSKLKASNVGEK